MSPDGRWIAYVSMESGDAQVYVQPFDKKGPKYQVSTDGGLEPLWSPDGSEIFYLSERDPLARGVGGTMMAVTIQAEPNFRVFPPRKLFEGDFLGNDVHRWVRNLDISPDGTRFLMVQNEREPVYTKIKIVLNSYQELERLLPPGM